MPDQSRSVKISNWILINIKKSDLISDSTNEQSKDLDKRIVAKL